MNNVNEKVVIVCAPSGSGKTSIVKYLLDSGLPLALSVSATSRTKRAQETDGKDYYFISADEFRSRVANGEFLEWQEVYENQFYGTLLSELDRIWKAGNAVIFDVDVLGGLNIKKHFGDKALSVFIKPPTLECLRQRLLGRGTETPETLRKRLDKSEFELYFEDKFDKVILNDTLSVALREAYNLISGFLKQ
ncbi:MAG: guanylate kinase [Bacteroidales bacterium]|nr:guanylate kinase [Bacteroidales bacterium]